MVNAHRDQVASQDFEQVFDEAERSQGMEAGRSRLRDHWQFWGVLFVTAAVLMGGFSLRTLIYQPQALSCRGVFWPFASASLRLYCAQERARQQTLEDLFAAIALVDPLDRNHPLRSAINPQIEIWSKKALDLAAEAFHQGQLERAIEFARKIPAQTAAAEVVDERVKEWQRIWAEGDGIFRKAEATLQAEQWRKAFWIMVDLLKVDCRHWSDTQYSALNKRILQAQQDELIVADARSLMRRGGLDNLAKALGMVQDMPPKSVFLKSANKAVQDISDKLLTLAERSLKRNDLTTALDAAQLIPRDARNWEKAQDFEVLAYASASAWSETITGLEDAIKEIQKIKLDSPWYNRAQSLALKWQGQIESIRDARQNPVIPEDPYRDLLNSEDYRVESPQPLQPVVEPEPPEDITQSVINEADRLSLVGDSQSLSAAIELADSVRPGQPGYENAQARVAEWKVQLERESLPQAAVQQQPIVTEEIVTEEEPPAGSDALEIAKTSAAQGSVDSLVAAINGANSVPQESPLRFQAQQLMESWSDQVLNLARRQAPTDPEAAIAIATRIPPYSPVYEAAQIEIRDWQTRQL